MTIDISSTHLPAALSNTVAENGNTAKRKDSGTVAKDSGSRDILSLTGTAQHLRRSQEALAQQPVVNTQRVEATKQAIENGSYQIDPQRIAGRMIELERALSGVN